MCYWQCMGDDDQGSQCRILQSEGHTHFFFMVMPWNKINHLWSVLLIWMSIFKELIYASFLFLSCRIQDKHQITSCLLPFETCHHRPNLHQRSICSTGETWGRTTVASMPSPQSMATLSVTDCGSHQLYATKDEPITSQHAPARVTVTTNPEHEKFSNWWVSFYSKKNTHDVHVDLGPIL